MLIRLMAISDYDKVYKLWAGTSGMGMRSLDDSMEGIERFLKRNPNSNFVAEEGEEIAGVILCGHDGRRGYIYHAAVESSFRGKGIGGQLVDSALEALRKEGINKVALVVFKSNEIGNAFWDATGFQERTDLKYRNRSINLNNI